MPVVFNRPLTKKEYLARVGDIGQSFGIRAMRYDAGKASFIRAFDVETAGGLRFSVNESKSLDLFDLSYNGKRLSFVTKAALSSPWIAEEQGMAYRNNLGAGFLYTAGLSNVGMGCEDGGFYHNVHGNLKNLPAENVCSETLWNGDDCTLRIAGDVRDSAFFGRNLFLHREITAKVGEKRLFIDDTIDNQGFAPEQIMLLYHMNLGFPLLEEGTEIIAPIKECEPMSEHTKLFDADYAKMTAPIDNNEEYLYALKLFSDKQGFTCCAAYNSVLRLGLYVRFNSDILRYLILWKNMSSGDYALGMLPSTCKPIGREADRQSGEAKMLEPFDSFQTHLEIGIIDGENEHKAFLDGLTIYDK